jgi:cation diffusion facilitator family transporter
MKHKACKKCAAAVGSVTVIASILLILFKGYLGVVGGSKGLIADAIHSCADLLAAIVMIIGHKVSRQETDEKYPYGYGKFEHIVAIIIYLFLFVIALYILFDGFHAIVAKRHVVPCAIALWGALISIAINELVFRMSACAGTQINSPSMLALAWESRSDVYSSIAVVVGIIGSWMGFHFMDPLAAIIVGLIILKICFEMSKEAILHLIDKVPDEIDPEKLRRKILAKSKDIILDVKNIWVREIGVGLEFHIEIEVPDCLTVTEGEDIKESTSQLVKGLFEREATVNVLLIPTEQVA